MAFGPQVLGLKAKGLFLGEIDVHTFGPRPRALRGPMALWAKAQVTVI